ncbi:MAG: hypothetical protein AN483_06945 [Aphanizomenon flos-aquae MDT14a]|jgi:hypothetical protein|nr:MAG: hypothetical protein AN483_06945 [Aphanizomenon flos-aquae MDT14a]
MCLNSINNKEDTVTTASKFYIVTQTKEVFPVIAALEKCIRHLILADQSFYNQLPGFPRFEITPSLKMVNVIFNYLGLTKNLMIQFHSDEDEINGDNYPKIFFTLHHNYSEGGELECLKKICTLICNSHNLFDWVESVWFCESDVDGEEYTKVFDN